MPQTSLELLTVIAAPALITNASSVLVLSTSNRFARAVDRSRTIVAELAKDSHDETARGIYRQLFGIIRRRTQILVRALTAFYLAVGSFALGTFLGLMGAAVERFGFQNGGAELTALGLGVVTIGTLAIAAGAVLLVIETRMALASLSLEGGLARHH